MGSDIKFLPMLSEMLSRDDFKEYVDWDPDTPESHSFRIKNPEWLLQKMEDVYGQVRRNNFEKDLTIRYDLIKIDENGEPLKVLGNQKLLGRFEHIGRKFVRNQPESFKLVMRLSDQAQRKKSQGYSKNLEKEKKQLVEAEESVVVVEGLKGCKSNLKKIQSHLQAGAFSLTPAIITLLNDSKAIIEEVLGLPTTDPPTVDTPAHDIGVDEKNLGQGTSQEEKGTSSDVPAILPFKKRPETKYRQLFAEKEMRILMVGLNAAGKTTILDKLKLGEIITTNTNGINVETVEYNSSSFIVWNVGAEDKTRSLWKQYFQNTQGIIFVVDSNDRDRLVDAKRELHRMLIEDELREVVLLVFANKRDLPDAMKDVHITHELGLYSLRQLWYIQDTCATSGEGLYEGLDWLSENIGNKA